MRICSDLNEEIGHLLDDIKKIKYLEFYFADLTHWP